MREDDRCNCIEKFSFLKGTSLSYVINRISRLHVFSREPVKDNQDIQNSHEQTYKWVNGAARRWLPIDWPGASGRDVSAHVSYSIDNGSTNTSHKQRSPQKMPISRVHDSAG